MTAPLNDVTVSPNPPSGRGGVVVPVLALFAAAITIPTLIAWIWSLPALAQPMRAFPAQRPLTVPLLWIAAAALIAVWRSASRAAGVLAVTLIVLSLASTIVLITDTSSAFGTAPTAAAMFVACGIALGMLARPPLSHRLLVIVRSIGGALLAMCGVLTLATLGELLQTDLARSLAQVSVNTTIGIVALSIALMRYVAAYERASIGPPTWLPVVVGVSGSLVVLVLWQSLVAREKSEASARTAIAADAVQLAIERQFDVIKHSVARVGIYVASADDDTPLWRTSIERLAEETVGLEGIIWMDTTGRVVRTTSDSTVSAELLPQLRSIVSATLRRAPTDTAITATALRPLGIAVVHRVRQLGRSDAMLVGIVSEQALLHEFVTPRNTGFDIRAFVDDSLIAGSMGTAARDGARAESRFASREDFVHDMVLGDRRIRLTLNPDPLPVRSTLPELLLVLGLATSALASATLWLTRKRWEQASVEGMARMQAAIERSTDGVWELDLLTNIAHRGKALIQSLGYQPKEVNGDAHKWNRLIHPDDAKHVARAIELHISGAHEAFECEYRFLAADGSWHTIVERGRVIERTLDRVPARMLGISADTTERARAEAEREESDRRFRTMFDSAFQVQLLVDCDGVILEANRAAADLAGLSVEAMQGTPFHAVRWWNADEATSARLRERLDRAGAGEATRFEVTTTANDGRAATIDFSLRPVRDASDTVVQVLVEGHDVTDRLRAQDSMRQITALSTMGQIAARVAHEINNPLAGIQNAFLLVRDGISEDHPHYRFVGAIEREIARIAAVTRQLYETYRPDEGTNTQSSVILAVSDAVSFLEQVNRTRNIRIVPDVTRAPSMVPLPDALLRQTLYNLIQNALDATPPNGTVEVSASAEDGDCVIRVRDEGPGIPMRIRERIFEPFFSTKDRTVKTGGMGIGLSLVRQSVLAVGGEVHVRDRAEGGTEFEVRLPMQPIDTGVLR